MKASRPPISFGLALGLACFLVSCRADSGSEILTVALEAPPASLDPRIGTDAASGRLSELMFNSLVRKGTGATIVPDLAHDWDTPDPLTYIFHLREGIRFHDGRPLTSADVVYTFDSVRDGTVQTAKAGTYRLVRSVEALDRLTVRFRLDEPFAPFLWNLTAGAIGIVPEGSGAEFSENPVGTGPFAISSYVPDGEILLEANPEYFRAAPRVNAVRFKIVPEAIVRALELRKGSVDLALNALPPDVVEALRDDATLAVEQAEGTNYQYLAFNLEEAVFEDVRVRRAIAHAIDRDEIVRHLWRGQARLADSVLPPGNWAYADDVARYPYDPERARDLLREAGYSGLSVTYRTSTDETGRLVASVLQHQLAEVGIDMEIRSNEFATFYADVIAGNFQMYSLRWIGGNNDPDIFNFIFHSEAIPPGGANRGHYRNSDVDAWIEAARRESDTEARRDHYRNVQRAVSEDLPYVNLWYLDNVAVFNRRVRGIELDPAGSFDFLTTVWLEEGASSGLEEGAAN